MSDTAFFIQQFTTDYTIRLLLPVVTVSLLVGVAIKFLRKEQ